MCMQNVTVGRIIPSKHLKNHFENSDKLGDKNPKKMTQEKNPHHICEYFLYQLKRFTLNLIIFPQGKHQTR